MMRPAGEGGVAEGDVRVKRERVNLNRRGHRPAPLWAWCGVLAAAAIGCTSGSEAPDPYATTSEVAMGTEQPAEHRASATVVADVEAAEEASATFASAEPEAVAARYEAPAEASMARPRRSRAPRRRGESLTESIGRTGVGGSAMRSAPPGGRLATGPAAVVPLPQNGVLANTFVGGNGASARLDDLLDRGVMVDGQRVRLSAFHERDTLPYARPRSEAVALHAEVERPRVTSEGDVVHLQVALMAREGELPRRPHMDIRLVIDRSGSMSGEKFRHAIDAAHQLVRRLTPSDRLGIIAYDSLAEVVLGSARVGDGSAAHRALDAMHPGGGTNIDHALALAVADPPRRSRPSDLAMVVLVSDGQATDGITAPSHLGATARSMFDDHGVITTAIGLGTDFDEETMLTIAREGAGSYHFVRRPADIGAILTDELEERAEAVAQALRVRVVLGEGVVARKIYGSRLLSEQEHAAVRRTEIASDTRIAAELGIATNRQREDEGLRMHLPTFRRGDQHVILMELEVPPGRAGSMAGIAHVYLDYKDLYRERNGRADVNVVARRVADRQDAVASTERAVKRTVLAFQAGEALQLAADALAAGDRSEAHQILTERREVLEAGAELFRDPLLGRDAALLAQYQRVVDGAWNGFGYGDQRTLVMAMNHFADRRMR